MMKRYRIVVVLSALCWSVSVLPTAAQGYFPMNIEKVMSLAKANNLTIKNYQHQLQLSSAKVAQAKEWWLPDLYAGFSTHALNGAAMNADGHIFTDVRRDNLWAGLGLAAEIDLSEGMYKPKSTRQQEEAVKYQVIAGSRNVVLEALHTYFDLQAEQITYFFMLELENQSDSLLSQLEVKYEAGMLLQSEVLMTRANRNHLKIKRLKAEQRWKQLSAELLNTLDIEQQNTVVNADTTLFAISLDQLELKPFHAEDRPEFLSLTAELNSIELMQKSASSSYLWPKIRLGFDDGAFGAYSTGGYNTYQLNASILWNLPLGRMTYKGDLKEMDAKLMIQKNRIQQFENQYEMEVIQALSDLELAKEQMDMAEEVVADLTMAYDQRLSRQNLGTAKAYEVFQIQQYLIEAKIEYVQAVNGYNKAQYSLLVAQGNNL